MMKIPLSLLLLCPVLATAQIYQCKDPAGRVTMQQTPCAGEQTGRRVMAPSVSQPSPSAPPSQNADARQLTALVAEAIARRDYSRAEGLAVTAEHWTMISDGRRKDAENQRAAKEAARRNRPTNTNCTMIANQMYCTTN